MIKIKIFFLRKKTKYLKKKYGHLFKNNTDPLKKANFNFFFLPNTFNYPAKKTFVFFLFIILIFCAVYLINPNIKTSTASLLHPFSYFFPKLSKATWVAILLRSVCPSLVTNLDNFLRSCFLSLLTTPIFSSCCMQYLMILPEAVP